MAFRGAVGSSTGTGSATFAAAATGGGLPSGPQNGDLILLYGTTTASGSVFAMSSPGFTSVTSPVLLSSTNCTLWALWKAAGGSEPSTYTVTATGAGSGGAGWTCQVACYTGRNITSPITAVTSAPVVFTGTPLSIACPTLTPASLDDLLFLGATGSNGTHTATLTAPGGYANVLDTDPNIANTASIHSCNNLAVAGTATGTVTGSIAFSGGINEDGSGFLISLAAAAAGPPPSPLFYNRKTVLYFIN